METITNKQHFKELPLKEALDKYEYDLRNGIDYDWSAWLEIPFVDFSIGKLVRGKFFPFDEIEEKKRKMESLKVTGYLLEWKDKNGEWYGSEFQPEKGTDGNLWCNDAMKDANDDWYENEVGVGYFKALPTAWFNDSCDWSDRLGVDFDARTTPTERPSPIDTWGNANERGELWRVRKITIRGELSWKARLFFNRNPDVVFDYAEE